MSLYWLHADDAGDTSLTPLRMPAAEGELGDVNVRGFSGIPTTGFAITEFPDGLPDMGLHAAPRRRFIALLGGAFEVTTTTGDHEVVKVGDGLLADDAGSKGHYSHQVSAEPVRMLTVEIPEDWDRSVGPPGSLPQARVQLGDLRDDGSLP